MAIAFAKVTIHSRAKGHSAVAASAYRTASCLLDKRTGIIYDFTKRGEVIFAETLLPLEANKKFKDREFLWNELEVIENRKNSQLCKDIVLALPKELELNLQIELTRNFAKLYCLDNGLPCDIAIHDDNNGNPHAHILTTLRCLENNGFAKIKARDLNPKFAKGMIVEQDLWGQRWRIFQNNFFADHNLDLTVDLNHLISEKHEGRIRSKHYAAETNKIIREARVELILHDPAEFIKKIAVTNSVFTRRDIEKLLFKTVKQSDNNIDFLVKVEEILSHNQVIKLGSDDYGVETYTTRQQYLAEAELLDNISSLQKSKNYIFSTKIEPLIVNYQLNAEQSQAFRFVTTGEDISVLIGRPGVGKSYLMKPIKEFYQINNCEVLGAALSGKVAQTMEVEIGIKTYTIASLIYRLKKEKLQLAKNKVLIIDEAGMVDFDSMSYLLNAASQSGTKIILIGDPDQLKPIYKGEIFRAIAEHTGYIELNHITRQEKELDRKASFSLAKGDVKAAVNHYAPSIKFAEDPQAAINSMVNNWQKDLNQNSITQHLMIAFTRTAVNGLNQQARLVLKSKSLLDEENFTYQNENGTQTIMLSKGERILFRKNNKQLGINNGDLATIISINSENFMAILDSGKQVIIPKTYKYVDYGYALTVHKAQGTTIDNVSVLIDSTYWDRNLSFVAMTRHRKNLRIYADKQQHPTIDHLINTMQRERTRDNVIDWPLNFAIRAGFDPDNLIGRVMHSLAKTKHKIQQQWNYLVNYDHYLKNQNLLFLKRQQCKEQAKKFAEHLEKRIIFFDELKKFRVNSTKVNNQFLAENFYQQSLELDKEAYEISKEARYKDSNIEIKLNISVQRLHKAAERYKDYLVIQSIVTNAKSPELTKEAFDKRLISLDLKAYYVHIVRFAGRQNLKPTALYKQIEIQQKNLQKKIFNELSIKYPVLAEYKKLTQNTSNLSNKKPESLNIAINKTIKEIMDEKQLVQELKNKIPDFIKKINIISMQNKYLIRE